MTGDQAFSRSLAVSLDAKAITKAFHEKQASCFSQILLDCFPVIDSTNSEIKRRIYQHEPELTVVTALEQQGGYGRQGRTWSSPVGGLYVSLLLRPQNHKKPREEFASLSLAMSIAARHTLCALHFPHEVLIKWPNDVICKEGKLCGVSLEVIEDAVCLGIGINLFQPYAEQKLEGKYSPVYVLTENIKASSSLSSSRGLAFLSDRALPKGLHAEQLSYMEDAVAVLLNEVVSVYNRWLVEGFSPFRDEYRAHAFLQGKRVRLVSLTNNLLHEGVVCDVEADGSLCLVDDAGSVIRAHSGEVHIA